MNGGQYLFYIYTKCTYTFLYVIVVGWLHVHWDTGLTLSYRYGTDGFITAYDIEPCDEPRILLNEPIAVGCLVRRGIVFFFQIFINCRRKLMEY